MIKPEWIVRVEEREAKATKGPWGWHGNTDCQAIKLSTTHSGRIYVMDFTRWGMRNAQPRFQNERGLMVKSSELVKYQVLGNQRVNESNKENLYRKDISGIDHPDAEFISNSRTDIPALLSALNKAMEAIEEAPHGQYCWLQHKILPQECSCWKYEALQAINNPTQKENSHE